MRYESQSRAWALVCAIVPRPYVERSTGGQSTRVNLPDEVRVLIDTDSRTTVQSSYIDQWDSGACSVRRLCE